MQRAGLFSEETPGLKQSAEPALLPHVPEGQEGKWMELALSQAWLRETLQKQAAHAPGGGREAAEAVPRGAGRGQGAAGQSSPQSHWGPASPLTRPLQDVLNYVFLDGDQRSAFL